MPMNSTLAPFGQILRKLCMFKPWQSREPLPCHNCPRRCSRITPHSNCHISYLTPPVEVFLNILESLTHELRIAHGLTLVTLSLRAWEALSTPGALIHIKITWTLSPTTTQVTGVTLGSPLRPWRFGLSLWRGARHSPPTNGVDALINYTRSRHTDAQVTILYGAALY